MCPGFTGRNCEIDIDECMSAENGCLNGGRCVDAVNTYTCDCANTGTVLDTVGGGSVYPVTDVDVSYICI